MVRLAVAALLAVSFAVAGVSPAAAQPSEAPPAAVARLSANAPRVLFAVSDSVKGNDGRRVRIVRTVTYHPAAGEYVDETVAADGRVLARRVEPTSVAAPTPTEWAAARALVAAHPEVAAQIGAEAAPVQIEGGFPLVREAGHPCGPGGRCVLVDVFATPPGADARRLRYVIVDLRALRVLDPDADPDADTNFAHPGARRQSRRQ